MDAFIRRIFGIQADSSSMDKEFRIRPATVFDADNIRKFLREYYIQDSPLNKCLKVAPCPELEDWCCSLLSDESSFKAINPADGELVGVLLNLKISRTRHFLPTIPEDCSPQYRKLMKFFHHLHSQYNLFDANPKCHVALEVGVLSVHPDYRGEGIGQALLDETMQFVRDMDIPLCYCISSSRYSGLACVKAGFEAVFTLPYDKYVLEDGSCPVKPEAPHTEAVLYAKRM